MDLKTRAVNATLWYAITRLWNQALSWGVTLILARLLVPEDYGLFAMAQAVVMFFELFQEFGLGVAIVQRQHLTGQQLNTIFWLVMATSVALASVVCLSAGLAAALYGEPRLVRLIQCMSVTFVLHALGVVPYSLLTKEINFRLRSLADTWGIVVSSGIAVALAYHGLGFWALIGGQLARAVVRNSVLFLWCGWRPRLEFAWLQTRDLLHFGLRVTGATTITTLSNIINRTIVGRFLGGHALGLYTMATTLGTDNPIHRLSTAVLNQLSLPVFSRLQQDAAQLRRSFLKMTKYLAVIALPAQIGTALVAADLVHVLLSDKWHAIVSLVQLFAVGGILMVVTLPASPLLTARDKAQKVFRFSCSSALVMLAAFLIGTQFGLHGAALAWLVSFPLRRCYLVWLSLQEINLSLRQYLANIKPALLSTGVMVVAILLTRSAFFTPADALVRLSCEVILGAVSYTVTLLLIDKQLGSEAREITRASLTFARVK